MRMLQVVASLVFAFQAPAPGEKPVSPDPVGKPVPTFERDIQPILTRNGCNAGPCHGKARGQNGFALSLFAYDHDFDHASIFGQARGRRVNPEAPDESILLRKAVASMAHGGGRKLTTDHPDYQVLRAWIAAGGPRTPGTAPALAKITVSPDRKLLEPKGTQQLRVTAHWADGSSNDVTGLALFSSSENVIAGVDPQGVVKAGPLPGEAAIMARYMDQFAVCPILIPQPAGSAAANAAWRENNRIDSLVRDKLNQLGLVPSGPCSDSTFLRRAFLDIIGTLPTPVEVEAFLADQSTDKRARLVDRLLARPEYADFWANKWADLLRPNPYHVGIKAVMNQDAWLRDQFRQNRPYDQFVRELLTAKGSTFEDGATVFYRNRREPEELTTMACQLFLGIRLDCAKCHHHPFEAYGQDDFYSIAAFFSRIGRKGVGISAPISGGEETILVAPSGTVKHPITGKEMRPAPLYGRAPEISPGADPREAFADWVTAPENANFAKVMANRVWAELMTRGIVEPVDDLRATNPPTNAPLLDHLAEVFRSGGYDIKKLIRHICASHAYVLSSRPDPGNQLDTRNFARHYRQRLRAEVLLDAVSDITGIPEEFEAMPPGSRAIQAWTVRFESQFLDAFGRPDPNQDPPCERLGQTTVVQALHLMNSPNIERKISDDKGRARLLADAVARGQKKAEDVVRELYLRAYCRLPSAEETAKSLRLLETIEGAKLSRREWVEDLMWALLNSPEFVFKD
jgi:hypothetical protein